jgi:hypothetical protein
MKDYFMQPRQDIIDEDLTDEDDLVGIRFASLDEQHEHEQSARLLANDSSNDSQSSSDNEELRQMLSPTLDNSSASPTVSHRTVLLASIRSTLFSPPPINHHLSQASKLSNQLTELNQVLGYTRDSLQQSLAKLTKFYCTLNELKSLHNQVGKQDGESLLTAIDQQKSYLQKLRWLPYLPGLIVLMPLIPGLLKLPTALVLLAFGKGLDNRTFNQYTAELAKLEHIGLFQKNMFQQKNAINLKLASVDTPDSHEETPSIIARSP